MDNTYSYRVRPQRYIDLDASVTLPPSQSKPRPARLDVFTLRKTINRNGIDLNVPQDLFEATTNSLEIDRLNCLRSSRRIALKPAAPALALVAIRDDAKTRRPIAFLNWAPRKIKGYFGKACVSTGTP